MPAQDFKGTINGNTITAGTGTLTMAAGKTLTVSDTLSLALGAADLKQFMNAAGTATEWASGLKIGTFTYDTATAPGTTSITGVGFKPKLVILFGGVDATTETCFGVSDGSTNQGIYNYGQASASAWRTNTTSIGILYQNGSDLLWATVSPMGADGFTINWSKSGSKTGTATFFYIAIR